MRGHVVDDLPEAAGIPAGGMAAGYGAGPENVLPTFFEWLDCWIELEIKKRGGGPSIAEATAETRSLIGIKDGHLRFINPSQRACLLTRNGKYISRRP
jgi:hypothetical protein